MKVKATKIKHESFGLTEGKEYEVLNKMPSEMGGYWMEIRNDIGLVTLIRLGFTCAVGKWEEVK